MKAKGVTTQMKALKEYFLMVVFPLLLNRVHVFANFERVNTSGVLSFFLNPRGGWEGVNGRVARYEFADIVLNEVQELKNVTIL